jgi:hypothetical protein
MASLGLSELKASKEVRMQALRDLVPIRGSQVRND